VKMMTEIIVAGILLLAHGMWQKMKISDDN
jgi:hypothetical protein